MNQLRFIRMLAYAFTLVFLVSCGGGGGEKANTDTTAATTDTAVNATSEANTLITTPENMMIVKHKVANFAKWKGSYDEHDSMRLVDGVHSYVIGRGVQDSNAVLVAVKVDDIAKAKKFAKDPSLKKAMQKGGVTGMPSFHFVTMTFQDTAVINSDIRSMTMFTVKDWDAWQKAFEEGKQERLDNGLTVRAYGHDVDDNKKVVLVTALLDTAKANAYWKSDMLKKRREASGVTSSPDRFVFRVVQRY
jgi:hypothetical protein